MALETTIYDDHLRRGANALSNSETWPVREKKRTFIQDLQTQTPAI